MYQFCYKQDYLHIIVFIFSPAHCLKKSLNSMFFDYYIYVIPWHPYCSMPVIRRARADPPRQHNGIDAMRKSQSRKEHN